jgi:double-stranded uracil-DNA glycosylase
VKRSSLPTDYATLPDYLRRGLAIVFVGINPGLFSAQQGHYFARLTSRFWPAFSQSHLSEPVRHGLGVQWLRPAHDRELPRFGFGLTDVVKRASSNASQLSPHEFEAGVPVLVRKLRRYRPKIACFHGLTAYRPFASVAFGTVHPLLGPQPQSIASTRLYVVPNPSPANAHFTLSDQTAWYDRLAAFLEGLTET